MVLFESVVKHTDPFSGGEKCIEVRKMEIIDILKLTNIFGV
jgi:hypothetical protein